MNTVDRNPEVQSPFADGLTADILLDVLLRGEARRAEATPLDAPTRGGLECHNEKVLALRQHLCPRGWTIDNTSNYCTVVSPAGDRAIGVARGTTATGLKGCNPETARPMGEATRNVVCTNKVQCDLPFPGQVEAKPLKRLTWLLLWYRDGDIVRSELSLPYAMNEEGFVCRWVERHILERLDLSPPPRLDSKDDRGDDDGEDAQTFDVPVSLR